MLEAIYQHYGFDFRGYALGSLKRRLWRRAYAEKVETMSALQDRVLHDPAVMERLLLDLSINVTSMFRDPTFFRALRENPDVDLVLMDVMMPEMDGYEATRRVRRMPEFEHLPIVALTAKAMKGDREKSIASGASDYIAKPVDTDRLLSLMRAWLDT